MRGSELMRRYIETVRADVRRGGKPAARQKHLDRLTAIRARLASGQNTGHDTMDEALRELSSLILSPRKSPGAPASGRDGSRQQQVSQQRPRASDDVSLYTINGGRRRGGK